MEKKRRHPWPRRPHCRPFGRETVTYVSNIYKYYITYRLLTEQRDRRAAAKAQVVKRQ